MAPANAAKEPSMEEILASIRQIIADEDAPVAKADKEETNDQAAIDDAFDSVDAGEDMSADDVDALFDAPGDASEEIDQSAIDAAFDGPGDDEEMSADDVDALFDAPEPAEAEESADEDGDLSFDVADGDADDDDVLTLSADQAVGTFDGDDDGVAFDADDSFDAEPAKEEADAAFDVPSEPEVASPAEMPAPAPIMRPQMADDESKLLLSQEAASSVKASFGALNSAMTVNAGHTLDDIVMAMLRPMLKEWLDDNLPEIVDQKVQAEIERMTRK